MANYPIGVDGVLSGTRAGPTETVAAGNTLLIASTCEAAVRITIRVGTVDLETVTIDGNGVLEYIVPAGTVTGEVALRGCTTHKSSSTGNGHIIFNGEGDLS